jgi:hypothetical protein
MQKSIIKSILIFIPTIFSLQSRGDLLDRVKLEDAMKTRAEAAIRITDPSARVIVNIQYNQYKEELPGTNLIVSDDYRPSKIESTDIKMVEIIVFTELDELPEQVKESLYSSVPFSRAQTKLEIRTFKNPSREGEFVNAKNISEIARQYLTLSSVIYASLFFVITVLCLLFFLIQGNKKIKAFNEQMQSLAKALLVGQGEEALVPQKKTEPIENQQLQSEFVAESANYLSTLSREVLRELFSDCYWAMQDGYAHWLWRNLSTTQQSNLYSDFGKMKEYALYFINEKLNPQTYHEHPFYIHPANFSGISQSDLADEVRQDFSRWHSLSPIRQEFLPLRLNERIEAVQTLVSSKSWPLKMNSSPRHLKTVLRWGPISVEDEVELFETNQAIPEAVRANIFSLVWLAQKDSATITQVLSQYDARAIASAWVGPALVLAKLEKHMPEKKYKIVQSYLKQTEPSRHSSTYLSLVREGLKNEAA